MSYFERFPLYAYDLEDTQNQTLITDILRRVNLKGNVAANTLVFDQYNVQDGEQPDIVARKYYGDSELHWVIVTVNNITSRYDWPLDQVALSDFVNDKYDNPDGIHHYEIYQDSGDTSIVIELPNDPAQDIPIDATVVTNYDYEEREVEKKRRIRLVRPEYVDTIREEFRKTIRA